MFNLLIATTNKGKVKELETLLADLSFNLKSLNEYQDIPEVEETGKSFAENAELKARYYALKTRCFSLADDSGLEVPALNDNPGVYSARYAGECATDVDNIEKLLKELEKTAYEARDARFICEMAVSNDTGKIIYQARGVCTGKITFRPLGNNGFGYDPLFVPTGYSETFGQLSSEIKRQISHRSKAVKQIIEYLRKFHAF